MAIRIEPLTGDTWPALEALFREGGDPRWCWCQFWRLRSKDFGVLKVAELRDRLRAQTDGDTPPGLVALEGERAVGWVSLGPRTDFARIEHSRVIPRIDDRPVWSIVCFSVSPSARGRGIGRTLLDAAVDHARAAGATALEAYPVVLEDGGAAAAGAAFTGTLAMFERAGFQVVAERASDPTAIHRRVVVRRELAAPAMPAI